MGKRQRRSPLSGSNRPNPRHSGSGAGTTGPPEPEFLVVGQIIRPHGVRGEVAMKLITDYPERLAGIETLFVGPDHHPYRVMRMRRHASGMLILFEGLADRDAADQLRSLLVHVHIQEAVPLEEGEYYYFQLHGVDVVTDQGQEIGRLTGYLETGANDVYIITTPDGQEVLIPAIPEVVLNIDLERRMITIRPMDGLL